MLSRLVTTPLFSWLGDALRVAAEGFLVELLPELRFTVPAARVVAFEDPLWVFLFTDEDDLCAGVAVLLDWRTELELLLLEDELLTAVFLLVEEELLTVEDFLLLEFVEELLTVELFCCEEELRVAVVLFFC